MKIRSTAFCVFLSALLLFTACSDTQAQWSDEQCGKFEAEGIDDLPDYTSRMRMVISDSEGTIVPDCHISSYGVSCWSAGENSGFVMKQYGFNQAVDASLSEVYYFDGSRLTLIDFGGDLVFCSNALCDGERLCYAVSDGSLRVLEKDGGRVCCENIFDGELYYIGMISLAAEGNTVTVYDAEGTEIGQYSL